MLRPATPLAVLFFAAFVLLLLSTLSTPLIKGIPLASFNGHDFGVWGYCNGANCTKIEVGYDTDNFLNSTDNFSLPSSTRHSVSYILIIHPVAALLALICFSLAVAAHFHSPAHSPRFLLALFILTIPTLLASLLAFLVDILLFIPHVSWGGWIVLASTILVIAASLVTCGMRRTLVSRKARRKRIQENAEMSGENYFNKREAEIAEASIPRAESPPPLSGNSFTPLNSTNPSLPNFDMKPRPSMDDRSPLNPGGSGSVRSGYNSSPPRDQYGNVIPGGSLRHQGSNNTMNSNRSGPDYGRGGRGGYPPNGRGGYFPRGGPMMRGGPGGMRGPPPPGWNGNGRGRGGMGPPGGYGGPPGGAMMGRGGPAPPGYGQEQYMRGPTPERNQSPYGQPPRNMSANDMHNDMGIGQAVELDERNGLPSPTRHEMPADEYVPPRAQWKQTQRTATPPLAGRTLSPIEASPNPSSIKGHSRRPSEPGYYEDVDPRFVEPPQLQSSPPPPSNVASQEIHPSTLQPPRGPPMNQNNLSPEYQPGPMAHHDPRQESTESLQDGQRSPAISDASHYTSVSQRGINPNWRPPPGSGMPRRPQQQDMLLNSNPEFSLPGIGPLGRGRGGPSGFRGRGGSGMSRGAPTMGLGPASAGGRYPGGGAL
ncbi:pali-domain-containing protein [Venturia nashicola]|uniref:Pali-domain-containing protein n=1 Tax=Venturia nashicola TaxID=86259 RepID=A0A4Z1NMR5_9PEZI|nr:pali-domain-containing protein [Venturia nashicola]TLD26046.1 pali-domain-containing protein [Venturia nashicola]